MFLMVSMCGFDSSISFFVELPYTINVSVKSVFLLSNASFGKIMQFLLAKLQQPNMGKWYNGFLYLK